MTRRRRVPIHLYLRKHYPLLRTLVYAVQNPTINCPNVSSFYP